jgi:DNA-binding SARP family transcriptional activator/streptogramin lyase
VARISYLILGPLEVREGETAVALSGGQQRKLLAILLLRAGEAVSSDRLIDELWHGEPPETAAKALQGYVSSLRKQLGPDRIETVGSGYRLSVAAADIDSRRFEELLAEARPLERAPAAAKLREALGLWRGPALADFAYEDFAQHEIERLEELHLGGIERRIDLELALGHHDDLVPELEALVRAHPLRERLRGFLMVALYRSGRQAEALDAYQDARRVLRDELGLEPSEELQALQRAILDHDESLAAPPRVDVPGAAGKHLPRESRGLRRPLIAAAAGLAILGGVAAAITLGLGSSKAAPLVALPNSVAMVDESGQQVERSQPVDPRPVALAVGKGGVWVANAEAETVNWLDPATGEFKRRLGIGYDVNDIAAGFGSVWVADGNDGTVTRIDQHLHGIEAIIPRVAQPTILPNPVFFVAVDSRYVWATRGDELLRIDPSTNQIDHRPLYVGTPTGLATGGGSVWVTTQSGQLLRIDPQTVQPTSPARTFSGEPFGPVYARGSLWLIDQSGIERIDPTSLGYVTRNAAGRPIYLAGDQHAVWEINSRGNLSRLIPRSRGEAVPALHVGKNPSGLAVGGGAVWVAVSAAR